MPNQLICYSNAIQFHLKHTADSFPAFRQCCPRKLLWWQILVMDMALGEWIYSQIVSGLPKISSANFNNVVWSSNEFTVNDIQNTAGRILKQCYLNNKSVCQITYIYIKIKGDTLRCYDICRPSDNSVQVSYTYRPGTGSIKSQSLPIMWLMLFN